MYLLRQTPLFLNDLDEVFAFLFFTFPLNCLGFGEEGRKEEKHCFPEGGGSSHKGFVGWQGNAL
jgi:hypothetical protein